MGKIYADKDMDRFVKIILRLLDKFKPQLLEEYGSNASNILDILYQEQCEKMPLMWYEYGFWSEE